LGCLALVLLAGCGGAPQMDYSQVNLVSAGGVVTLDGQPLPAAVITFESADGQFSYAMTDSAGKYELQFDSDQAGVTPGPKTVRISTTRKLLALNAEDGAEAGEASEEGQTPSPSSSTGERVPAKYNQQSELNVEVSPDRTEFNFDLTSK
jgi:hypothetical protein